MRELRMKLPEIVFVAATRGMLGFGMGLVLGARLPPRARRALGATFLAIGAVTTIPSAALIVTRRREARLAAEPRFALG